MSRLLIIGCGGVAQVAIRKCCQNSEVFEEICIASRTKSKCDAVVKAIGNPNIKTAQVDADNVDELVALFNSFKPDRIKYFFFGEYIQNCRRIMRINLLG